MRSRGVTLLCTIVLLLLGASAAVDRVRHNDAVHSSPSPSTLPSRTSPSLRLSAGASCANNGTACPPPLWAPQWNLTLSTVCQPSTTGYFVPPPNQPWGLVSLDWSVASDIWHKATLNTSTIEATSIEGCRRIKANSPGTRCFIYHNMELALEAMESQRLVMYDSLYANWFLQYQTPSGMKNGTIYNEPGGPGDQYFWDFRVAGARDFFVNSVLAATSDPAVDGTYSDDVDGFPAEHSGGPANINMTAADVADLQYWTQSTHARLLDELISRNKYNCTRHNAHSYRTTHHTTLPHPTCVHILPHPPYVLLHCVSSSLHRAGVRLRGRHRSECDAEQLPGLHDRALHAAVPEPG